MVPTSPLVLITPTLTPLYSPKIVTPFSILEKSDDSAIFATADVISDSVQFSGNNDWLEPVRFAFTL